MTIEKDAEDIIEKFSKILEDIPDSDETWYITDNLNLTREDKSQAKNPEKILRNARIDKKEILLLKKQIGQVRGI
jgi:aspartyl-tRNA(Asn)/glutamyl-tRNA(Gln) amidotransferase subunit C